MKLALHALRIAAVAETLLSTGVFTLQVEDPEALRAQAIAGLADLEPFLASLAARADRFQMLGDAGPLPDEPDRHALAQLQLEMRQLAQPALLGV